MSRLSWLSAPPDSGNGVAITMSEESASHTKDLRAQQTSKAGRCCECTSGMTVQVRHNASKQHAVQLHDFLKSQKVIMLLGLIAASVKQQHSFLNK